MDVFELFSPEFDQRFWAARHAEDWDELTLLIEPTVTRFLGPAGGLPMVVDQISFETMMTLLDSSPKLALTTIGDGLHMSLRTCGLSSQAQAIRVARMVFLLAIQAQDLLPLGSRSAANLILNGCLDIAQQELAAGLDRAVELRRLDPQARIAFKKLSDNDQRRLSLRRHDFGAVDRDGRFTTWTFSYEEIALLTALPVKGCGAELLARAETAARAAHARATRRFWINYRSVEP